MDTVKRLNKEMKRAQYPKENSEKDSLTGREQGYGLIKRKIRT